MGSENYVDVIGVMVPKGRSGIMRELELAVERSLERKNERRRSLAKPPLKDYFWDFALLQEVTKAACRKRASHLRRRAQGSLNLCLILMHLTQIEATLPIFC